MPQWLGVQECDVLSCWAMGAAEASAQTARQAKVLPRPAYRVVALIMLWAGGTRYPSAGVVAVAACVTATGAGGASAAIHRPACSVEGATTARVAAVVDGDTLQLSDGRVIRLAGIEAPERPLGLEGDRPWPLSEAARHALEQMVAGKTVRMVVAQRSADRHGRWRANLFIGAGDQWVQALLVAAGWARVHWLPSDSPCIFALLDQEEKARAAAKGLWIERRYAVRRAGEPSLIKQIGLYELVQGRVTSVGHGRYMIFLDFGDDYRRDFSVMIPPAVARGLAEAGLPADRLKGRQIRVRGVVENSGGPAIRLNDPAEIELLDDGGD